MCLVLIEDGLRGRKKMVQGIIEKFWCDKMSKFSHLLYHRRRNVNCSNEHCKSVNRRGHPI